MALTAAQKTHVYEILGIPESGTGYIVDQIASIFGPTFEIPNFAAVITYLNTAIAAITATQQTRVETHLTRWTTIGGTSQIFIAYSGKTGGVLADNETERQAIRNRIGDILGIAVPLGGFTAEINRRNGQRITR